MMKATPWDSMKMGQYKESCLHCWLYKRKGSLSHHRCYTLRRAEENLLNHTEGGIADYKPTDSKRYNNKDRPEGSRGQHSSKTRFICNKLGYIAKYCRNKVGYKYTFGQSTDQNVFAACIHSEKKDNPVNDTIEDGRLKFENGESLPIISDCRRWRGDI